jgi:uncharacterized zinc-type alcohol dehydrogenase-like protein
MTEIHGWATHGPKQKLEPFTYSAGLLGPEEVEVAVEYCGFCYSDISMMSGAGPSIRSFRGMRWLGAS